MIAAAARQLPPQMPAPPSYQKVNPADSPIMYLALTSSTLPLSQLDEYGETFMAQRISMVPGIAQVQVYGGQKYAVRVQLDPTSLANRGIGIDEVAAGRRQADHMIPGFGSQQGQSLPVETDLEELAEIWVFRLVPVYDKIQGTALFIDPEQAGHHPFSLGDLVLDLSGQRIV